MKKPGFFIYLLILLVPCLLTGCLETGLHIKIQFDRIYGLEKGDRVLFRENHIGGVQSVYHTKDGRFLVGIHIRENFENAATEHCRFSIGSDPRMRGRKAVKMTRLHKGGFPLKEGAVVSGTPRPASVAEKVKERLERGAKALMDQLDDLGRKFKDVPETQAFKDLKKEMERLPGKIKDAGEKARKKMEKEVIPALKKKMEELKKSLAPPASKEEEAVKT